MDNPAPSPAAATASRWKRRLSRWLVFGLVVYLAQIALLKLLENKLVFPASGAADWSAPPEPVLRDVGLHTADGTALHAWHFAHPAAGRSVLFLHGNGGNLSHRGRFVLDLGRLLRASVLIVDYPGYGRSGGSPSEEGCYAAADAAYDWLTVEQKVPADRLVIFGESLGGGVAVDLASRRDHAALVLLNTFATLPDTGQAHYPWLPVRWLSRYQFNSVEKIAACRRPTFIAHGTADSVIPFAEGRRLFEAAPGPKRFLELPGYDHNVILSRECMEAMREFLDQPQAPVKGL
jgi:fermentation-respiration switch protein FrsA (DUF1100 family)